MTIPFSLAELEAITREAGSIAQAARRNLVREIKPDGSLVTNGDREVETFLRSSLARLLPGSRTWGEEFGIDPGEGPLWLVDPVDGTSNYAFGQPIWGVSIGLAADGELVAGAIYLPDLGMMSSGTKGARPIFNGEPMALIPAGPVLDHELVAYPERITRVLAKRPGNMRCSGAFVADGLNVCLQRLRGLIGIREKLYDVAPTVLFARELGADVRYVDGSPFQEADLLSGRAIEKPWIVFPADSGYFGA
jgi:myo-inositol-1(or 4)-monophosphatase